MMYKEQLKKKVGSGAFASVFGMLGFQQPLYQRRFGKKQVDAIQKGLSGYSARINRS